MKHKWIYFFLIIIITISSCKKDSFITSSDAIVFISADTVKFDTVFTTIGSVTQSFKIYNNNDQSIRLSSIKLMGGLSSPFKMNVNGVPANEVNDYELAPNDSMYVFVRVNINPSTDTLPFIINDKIVINYNGNEKFVALQAYGQNAHFYRDKIITDTAATWTNDLPYVILGSLQIQNGATLTIQKGCRIYAHATAPILVDGTLKVEGQKDSEVVFSGDRLDYYYKDLPASWPGIFFQKNSKNNDIRFAVIKNADYGITVNDSTNVNDTVLSIHQTVIDNALSGGLYLKHANVKMDNSLISNCGKGLNIEKGGIYDFTNCTIVSVSSKFIAHTIPAVQIRNYHPTNDQITNALNVQFNNCIIWGEGGGIDDEIFMDAKSTTPFVYAFDSCIYKGITSIANVTNGMYSQYNAPLFNNIDASNNVFDFRITDLSSPAVSHGKNIPTSMEFDLDNNLRGSNIDIGCYKIN